MQLEKTTRMNFLFDFYQALLTEKQRSYMEYYYLDDLSLGEIAEEYEVSRQAVYDNIRRTGAMLEEYERKLRLFEKFQHRQALVADMTEMVKSGNVDSAELLEMMDRLKEWD